MGQGDAKPPTVPPPPVVVSEAPPGAHDEEVLETGVTPDGGHELDCYPYTFSPLLLFAQGNYFDKALPLLPDAPP